MARCSRIAAGSACLPACQRGAYSFDRTCGRRDRVAGSSNTRSVQSVSDQCPWAAAISYRGDRCGTRDRHRIDAFLGAADCLRPKYRLPRQGRARRFRHRQCRSSPSQSPLADCIVGRQNTSRSKSIGAVVDNGLDQFHRCRTLDWVSLIALRCMSTPAISSHEDDRGRDRRAIFGRIHAVHAVSSNYGCGKLRP